MKDRRKYYIVAAAFSLLIFFCIYIFSGFYPFGTKTMLTWDMDIQYSKFLTYLCGCLHGENAWGYTQTIPLGGSTIGLFSYYLLSPFNLILLFFSKESVALALPFIYVMKYIAMTMSMLWFLFSYHKQDTGRAFGLSMVAVSLLYTYSGYAVFSSSNIMWLDGLILLPLIAGNIEGYLTETEIRANIETKIDETENDEVAGLNKSISISAFLVILLALAILTNYYFGYMLWIFSSLFAAAVLYEKWGEISDVKTKLFGLCLSYILAGLISCVIIIPLLGIIGNSNAMGESFLNRILNKIPPAALVALLLIAVAVIWIIARYWRKWGTALKGYFQRFQKKSKMTLYCLMACCGCGLLVFIFISAYFLEGFGLTNFNVTLFPLKQLMGSFSVDEIKNGMPSVYVGMAAIPGAFLFLTVKKINIRRKVSLVALILIIYFSMLLHPIDLIWHGFSEPGGFPYRYAFLLGFVALTMLADALAKVSDGLEPTVAVCGMDMQNPEASCIYGTLRENDYSAALNVCDPAKNAVNRPLLYMLLGVYALLCIISVVFYGKFTNEFLSIGKVLISALFLAAYLFLYFWKSQRLSLCSGLHFEKLKSYSNYLFLILIAAELVVNGLFYTREMDFVEYGEYYDNYVLKEKIIEAINEKDTGVFRIADQEGDINDGFSFGYDSLSGYFSTFPSKAISVLKEYGMDMEETLPGRATSFNYDITSEEMGDLNVRYILSREPLEKEGLKLIENYEGINVYKNLDWKSRILCMEETGVSENCGNEVSDTLKNAKECATRIWSEDGRLKANVSSESNIQAIATITYDENLKILIDGEQVSTLSQKELLGFEVPAGEHLVEIYYEKRDFYLGLGISLVSLLVLVAVWGIRRRRYENIRKLKA